MPAVLTPAGAGPVSLRPEALMRAAWIAILLVACGGDGSSDTAADTDTDGGTLPADLCEGIPEFHLTDLDCAQLASALDDIVDAADRCNTVSDCKALRAECEHWNEVTCDYVANTCVTASLWSELNGAAASCGEANMVCECGEPPEVACISGKCQFVY